MIWEQVPMWQQGAGQWTVGGLAKPELDRFSLVGVTITCNDRIAEDLVADGAAERRQYLV